MKINIITVLNTKNYGSILQTYASNEFWKNYGFDVEFMDYIREDQSDKQLIINRVRSSKRKSIISLLLLYTMLLARNKKEKKIFRKFLTQNLRLSDRQYHSCLEIIENLPDADIYCTGSDQMWNSAWNKGVEESFFLKYAPDNKRKISFSTSIGKIKIEEEEQKKIIPLLHKYELITVREASAEALLRSMGIEASTVLDPTLMVDKTTWEKLLVRRKFSYKYVLVYKLHPSHGNINFMETVKFISHQRNTKVVEIVYSYEEMRAKHKTVCLPTIKEFLSLFYYADYVVTDSFHGTAFSINFNKNFSVVMPNEFGTRIQNIVDLTGLEKRVIKSIDKIDYKDIDYTDANIKLLTARNESKDVFDTYVKQVIEDEREK